MAILQPVPDGASDPALPAWLLQCCTGTPAGVVLTPYSLPHPPAHEPKRPSCVRLSQGALLEQRPGGLLLMEVINELWPSQPGALKECFRTGLACTRA